MRIFHYAIIFAIIAIVFITIRDISYAELETSTDETYHLNQEFHKAVDHAVETLSYDEQGHIIHSGEDAVTAFLDSIYASFDLFLDPEGKQRLQLYLPLIVIVDEDGLYLNYLSEEMKEGSMHLIRMWSSRIPYRYDENNEAYEFTLSKEAWHYDSEGQLLEILETKDQLEQRRRETICATIEEFLVTYMNEHNYIAQQYGIVYHFTLPAMDNSFYSRSIEKPTMLVLFQGYPLVGNEEVYNSVAFGGASLIKKDWYQLTKMEGYYLYHNQECVVLLDNQEKNPEKEQIICANKEECASLGAFPCQECFPSGKNYDYLGYIHMKN